MLKNLKILLLIIVVLMVILIVWSVKRNHIVDNLIDRNIGNKIPDVTENNKTEVLNNGDSILEYNGYVYYINTKNTSR